MTQNNLWKAKSLEKNRKQKKIKIILSIQKKKSDNASSAVKNNVYIAFLL